MASTAQDEWISRVLGIDPVATHGVGLSFVELTSRLGVIREDMLRLKATDELAGKLRTAAEALKRRDSGVGDLVDALERRIAEIASAQRMGEVSATIDSVTLGPALGPVALAKLQLRLDEARAGFDDAVENLQVACESLMETDAFEIDPRSDDPATLAIIAKIGSRVPSMDGFGHDVTDAIDRMRASTEATAQDKEKQTVLAAIKTYRSQIDAVPLLTEMEDTDAGSFAIHSKLTSVLDELAAALSG